MRNALQYTSLLLPLFLVATPAEAKKFERGTIRGDFRVNLDAQSALIDSSEMDSRVETDFDWALRLKLEHKIKNEKGKTKLRIGGVIKLDQDFETGSELSMRPTGINRRLSYVYARGKFGTIAIGDKAGQADRLAIHAPQVGIGQIRGDISRYGIRSVLLNPYDTQNSTKIDYVSPRGKPVQIGVSYAPLIRDSRTGERRNSDGIELAAKTTHEIAKKWQLQTSVSYVGAKSEIEKREDIDSWGLGASLSHGEANSRHKTWTIAGAYVSRGDSSTSLGTNEEEFNLGVEYRKNKIRIGLSAAHQNHRDYKRQIIGIGTDYKINKNIRLRVSATHFNKSLTNGQGEHGNALITDIRFHY